MSFRNKSIELTTSLTKEEKQTQGIFFTPKEAREIIFTLLDFHNVRPRTILEPSFGSGEFLEDMYAKYPEAQITGIELNHSLFQSTQRPNTLNIDFLKYNGGTHDLIVGNPPYFVILKNSDTEKCQSGRPNMFVQFLYKCVDEHLISKGILAFVLPTSFFNCIYYEPMRKYLFQHTTILEVKLLPGRYIDTDQSTFALILKKEKCNDDYFVSIGGNVYITPYFKELRNILKHSKTLKSLGYEVKTGDVVWNQHKEKLDDSGTLLVYSSNFSKGNLVFGNLKLPKKQYIKNFKKPYLSGKTILINRGYGNTSYKLTAVIADYPAYYAENHVNVIKPQTANSCSIIGKVHRSLCDDRTAQFIQYFIGNGALSKSEIENCLPIWID
jgi:hypothetical protein